MRSLFILTFGLLLVCAWATAMAGDIYQWKDAHGVTQYSSTPPSTGAYKVRTIRDSGQPRTATAAAQPAEDPACAIARKNLEVLRGKAAIQIDSDHDGKPDKMLSSEDRANQLQLAQSTLKVNCAPAAAPPAG